MKWTLITGATSGIGAACAEALASPDMALWLQGRREERLIELAKRLSQKGAQVKITPLDLTNRDAVEKFQQNEKEALKNVAALINNAGLALGASALQVGHLEDWRTMLETNVMGLLAMTRLALPGMIERGAGHVINIGSVAGRWAYPGGNVYCASKAAVHSLSESMRLDLLGTGVRVSEILPGMVETEFSEVRFKNKEKAKKVYDGMTPLSAQDVAEAVRWCLERPQHVNVQEIVLYPTAQASPGHVYRSPASRP